MTEETLNIDSTESAEGEATATAVEETRPLSEPTKPHHGYWWGTGRRKSAVARCRVKPGDGKFLINGKEVDVFFTETTHRNDCRAPLQVTRTEGKMDVLVRVHGGGITGQAGAVLLGIARALKGYDPTLEAALRDAGHLTRDAREVERKKPGQPGARKRFQFSKR